MPDQNVELIQRAYDAFARGDIPEVMSVLADDIEWHVPAVLPQGMTVRGNDEVGGFFHKLGDVWEDFELRIEEFVASGDRVCVLGSASGKIEGAAASYGLAHAWTVEDGACTKFVEYADPSPELLSAG